VTGANERSQRTSSLKYEGDIGYALAMNNTRAYRLVQADNPFYTRMATFGPLSLNNSEEMV
jgi:hypothetical protein